MQSQKDRKSPQKNSSEEQKDSTGGKVNVYAKYSGIVFQMAVIIGGGTYGGVLLDKRSEGDFKLYTLIFSLVSVFIALYLVIKQVINDNKDK